MVGYGINLNSLGNDTTPGATAALCEGDPSLAFSILLRDNLMLTNVDVANMNDVKPVIEINVESFSNSSKRLRNILGKYESMLQKRWLKKTKEHPHEERPARTVLLESILPTKLKTRGTPTEAVEEINAQRELPSTEIEDEVRPLFRLDKRVYKVFSSIFRLFTKDGVPGEVPWSDFINAMVSIGFPVQSLDGSASVFSPADGSLSRSIIFHEPHPMSKIPYLVARWVGRRLNRTFGWTAENLGRE
ncbi:MAG: hypothetical protein Q9184_000290 [Pyrenodesmia sp. 2 TL-2023]